MWREIAISNAALDRLSAYEDIGLEPEQVRFLKTLMEDAFSDKSDFTERLRVLSEADKSGRVIVLPCNVDDKEIEE